MTEKGSAGYFRRRHFLTAAGAMSVAPFAGAQERGRVRRIALFLPSFPASAGTPIDLRPRVERLLRERLAAHGFMEGRNLDIVSRGASWDRAADVRLVQELAATQPDAIFVIGSTLTSFVLEATRSVPVVFANVSDPVEEGIVKSYSRPGGNATGISDGARATMVKRLELLREMLPKAKRVALSAPLSGKSADFRANEALLRRTGAQLGFEFVDSDTWGITLDISLYQAAMLRPDAIFVYNPRTVVGFVRNVGEVQRFTEAERIPWVAANAEDAELGALLSYGTNFMESIRRGVDYLARVLNGAKPADLPVDQAMRFELVVNLKTARALGIAVPQSVLVRADRVIE